MPGISVIVPVYKVEAYLDRCVSSILGQSFQDFELILVDDGSPDNCGSLCDEYAAGDSRIHVIHQKNGGLSAARNAGIDWVFENSDSRWLAFVDSDDWVSPDYLRLLYRAVSETGNRISACGFYRTSGEALPPAGEEDAQVLSAEDYYCGTEIHGGVTMVAWNKLYHRSLFESLRYPVGKLHEDEFTTYRAIYQAGAISVIQAQLYAYYQNPTGIMGSKWNPRRIHVLEAVEQQIAYAREKNYRALEKRAVNQYVYSTYEHLKAAGSDPEYRKYMAGLRRKLRAALKLGRDTGVFPLCREKLWAYEEAYPLKPFWWLLSKCGK